MNLNDRTINPMVHSLAIGSLDEINPGIDLWTEAALRALATHRLAYAGLGLHSNPQDAVKYAFDHADAFIAERARRLKLPPWEDALAAIHKAGASLEPNTDGSWQIRFHDEFGNDFYATGTDPQSYLDAIEAWKEFQVELAARKEARDE